MQRATGLFSRHALALLILLGGLVRFATLGAQDFWLDELVTVQVIGQSPIDLLKSVAAGESNPGLYYLLAGGWEHVFGDGEFALRSLSALFGTATIPAVYAATAALSNRRAGLVAAALTATSPLLVWYSQEARNYSLLVLLSALAFLFFARALEDRDHRWLWAWALTSGLALSTHYFAVALVAPQVVWLWMRRPGPRADTAFATAAIGVVGIALLPLLATQRGRGDWISFFALGDRLGQVPQHFVVGLEVPWAAIAPAAAAVAVGAATYAAIRAGARARRGVVIATSVVVAAIAILLLAALAGDDYIVTRNVIELWVPFAIALAIALGAGALERLGVVVAAALCALGLGLVAWSAATPEAQRPAYADLAAELGTASQQRLLVSQTGFSAPLILYLDGTRFATDEELTTSELVVITPRVTEDYSVGPCWWISTCGGTDLEPVPPFAPPPAFELQSQGSTEGFDYDIYTAPRPTPIERPVEFLTPRVFVQPAG